ncbi:MAG: hypothetical protein R2772_02340 [Chitinophagales bacterium]
MQKVVRVVTQEEYDKWVIEKNRSYYYSVINPDASPELVEVAPVELVVDSLLEVVDSTLMEVVAGH